jgi:ketosteroid isomerase-like protein
MMKLACSVTALAACLSTAALAIDPASKPADRAAAFDRAFFQAFNTCDLKTLTAMTVPDLEFFHDLNGIQRGREAFLSSIEKNVCGKFTREAVAETMESWTLGKDGVIYSGAHRFCQAGKQGCQGSGRYLHVLTKQEGKLVVTRVISYDHRAIDPPSPPVAAGK